MFFNRIRLRAKVYIEKRISRKKAIRQGLENKSKNFLTNVNNQGRIGDSEFYYFFIYNFRNNSTLEILMSNI